MCRLKRLCRARGKGCAVPPVAMLGAVVLDGAKGRIDNR
jgi:hypothetical protein